MNTILTPAMQQYYDIKKEYNDSVIFFRMGDFYEMFWDDAYIAHKILWINVTSRNKNSKNPEALAWIPYHAKDKYLPILVNAWYKVAIVEQVSDPNLKWIVKREVIRVVTPSTLSLEWDNFDLLIDSSTIISILESSWIYWLSIIDLSSNKWSTQEFLTFDELSKQLYILSPKEVILDKKLFSDEKIKEVLSKKYSLNIFYYEFKWDSYQKLINHFKVKSLNWFWIDNKKVSILTSALLLDYLEVNQKTTLSLLDTISYINNSNFLQIDDSTLKNLDIIYNFSTQSYDLWTLFWVLNQTKTPMGKRYLKENILKPLQDKSSIELRQKFIQEFLNNKILLDELRKKMSFISDLDAILNRIILKRVTPKDLLNLKKSLQAILEILELVKKEWSEELVLLLKNI